MLLCRFWLKIWGRINYGSEIVHNTKGIISPVQIAGKEIVGGWDMYQLPMDEMPDLTKLKADTHKMYRLKWLS